MTQSNPAFRHFKVVTAVVILCVFFAVLLYNKQDSVDWSRLRFSPGWATAAFALGLAQHLLASICWCKVLKDFGARVPAGLAIRAYLIGDLGKYLPGKVWAVAGKAAIVAHAGVSFPLAISAATQETLLVLASGCLVALTYVSTAMSLYSDSNFDLGLVVPLAAGGLLLMIHPGAQRVLLQFLARVLKRPEPTTFLSIRDTIVLLGMYCGLWMLAGVIHLCLFIAISTDTPPTWLAMSGMVSLATVMGFLAVFSPGGLGVREATMATMLLPLASVETIALFVVVARILVTASQGLVTIVAVALTQSPQTGLHTDLTAQSIAIGDPKVSHREDLKP